MSDAQSDTSLNVSRETMWWRSLLRDVGLALAGRDQTVAEWRCAKVCAMIMIHGTTSSGSR